MILTEVIVRRIKERVLADPRHLNLKSGDHVILETEYGMESGFVTQTNKTAEKPKNRVGKILRKITPEDERRIEENNRRAKNAFTTVVQKAQAREIDMKLTCVQYTLDRSKLFVYYTSESRIDFRELIKDLGHALKTRIQMVQIGVRDESKMVGGIGTCGQVLCCSEFLREFSSVTIDMAKEQGLSLNTAKLSGLCGRLMCCIAYENDHYAKIKKMLPHVGAKVSTPQGYGVLAAIDAVKETATVDFGTKGEGSKTSASDFKTFPIETLASLNTNKGSANVEKKQPPKKHFKPQPAANPQAPKPSNAPPKKNTPDKGKQN
ncbi:MAG: stage 0 sporulation protein [Elusimicrobia bacterium]|nr:stage 0 sporulation protein [Elusimicrobiota bacterium]